MSDLGRYARVSLARELVWDILRKDEEWASAPFTMKEFYERHKKELMEKLKVVRPDASLEGIVRGALQSLSKKGLLEASKSWGDIQYTKNMYYTRQNLLCYSYGRALIEAQRLRLL
jgi:hypothetical protein